MKKLDAKTSIELMKVTPEERFEYALSVFIENKELWGLYGDNGWLLLKAEDDACLPVWPHEELAVAWEKNEFPDCQPKTIDLETWMEQWLPGMQKNNTLVLMFPLSDDEEGVMLEAEEVLQCLQDDLAGK